MERDCPILEFDHDPRAIIEPAQVVERINAPRHCVLCFFPEVLAKICREQDAKTIFEQSWESGLQRVWEIGYGGHRLAFMHPGVGAPLAAGLFEVAIALGCSRFIAVGGCGVLDKNHPVGKLFVPTAAVRDEGTSYHYLPPSRTVTASGEAVTAIEKTLTDHGVPYEHCLTWTTDGFFRETAAKAQRRKDEGCVTVEMEAAAFFAVARFRGVCLGQILYAGDVVQIEGWDRRPEADRSPVREELFWLAAEACLRM